MNVRNETNCVYLKKQYLGLKIPWSWLTMTTIAKISALNNMNVVFLIFIFPIQSESEVNELSASNLLPVHSYNRRQPKHKYYY